PELDVEARNAVAQRLALRPNVGRQLALLLHESRVDLGGGVALGLELVQLPRERAATNVEGFELVEQPRGARVAAAGERGAPLVGATLIASNETLACCSPEDCPSPTAPVGSSTGRRNESKLKAKSNAAVWSVRTNGWPLSRPVTS